MRTALAALAALAALPLGGCGRPGDYPSREIRIVVQAAPGGISDAVSRHVARGLQQELGTPVVAENRAGAAGSIAFSHVARSRPDGYTVGYAPVEVTIVHHLGYSATTPDDFDFLMMHTRAPACLAVRADSPWRDLGMFLGAARDGRRPINVATAGSGSIWHLAGVALARHANVRFTYVPFAGSGPAVTALLGGHADAVVAAPSEVAAHVAAETLRLLGVMAGERSPLFPDLPTFGEQGYDLRIHAWGGFMLPKGVPADRRETLAAALRKVVDSDAFRRFARENGLELALLEGREFHRFVTAEDRAYGALVKDAGL